MPGCSGARGWCSAAFNSFRGSNPLPGQEAYFFPISLVEKEACCHKLFCFFGFFLRGSRAELLVVISGCWQWWCLDFGGCSCRASNNILTQQALLSSNRPTKHLYCPSIGLLNASDRMLSQHEHDPPKAKRKRTESHADGKEGGKSSQQKQNNEFFYKALHEYDRIQIATVEASDLLRAVRRWPDHI